MNIHHFIRLNIIFVFLIFLPFSTQAAKPLRFELAVADFYNPFLTDTENESIKQQLVNHSVSIIGHYEAKSGRRHEASCMTGVMCFPFGGKWVDTYESQSHTASIIDYDTSSQKVIFELPESVKAQKLNLKLVVMNIELTASGQSKKYNIRVPYNPKQPIYNIKGSNLVGWSLEPQLATYSRSSSLSSDAGIAVQLSRTNSKSGSTVPFTPEERKALFGHNHLSSGGASFKLDIPAHLSSWLNLGRSEDGYKKAEGMWVHDKQNRMEAISLEGGVYYEKYNSFRKDETWLKTNGQLSHIYKNPIHFDDGACGFIYGAVFYPDGTEQRYFIPKLSQSERYDDFAVEAKKQLVSSNDLSLLTEFEQSKETYYTGLQERGGRDRSTELAACKRLINDARHILTSPKAELESEYAQYRQLIQNAMPKNVRSIRGIYGTDGKQVFLGSSVMKGVNLESFEILDNPCPAIGLPTIKCSQRVRDDDKYDSLVLTKDKNHVYKSGQIFTNNMYRRTPSDASADVDANSFQLFYVNNRTYYYIDKYRIYKLSAGAIDASFDTQGTVYGPIGDISRFAFLDDNGFFNILGDRVGLCTEFHPVSEKQRRGTMGNVVPLSHIPSGISWAVEDDNYEYYLVDVDSKGKSYMIDKKTALRYPVFMGDGNCREPIK